MKVLYLSAQSWHDVNIIKVESYSRRMQGACLGLEKKIS
jgi:hypothetical protein